MVDHGLYFVEVLEVRNRQIVVAYHWVEGGPSQIGLEHDIDRVKHHSLVFEVGTLPLIVREGVASPQYDFWLYGVVYVVEHGVQKRGRCIALVAAYWICLLILVAGEAVARPATDNRPTGLGSTHSVLNIQV